jgi:L-fuconate dehydratase
MDNLRIALDAIQISPKDWEFSDVRLSIPPLSFGSDAANSHTQYSNAVARVNGKNLTGRGMTFTLGEGNQFVCEAAKFIVDSLEGRTFADLLENPRGFHELLTNPSQLRWISPYSGLPMMAAGLVINTLIDAAAEKAQLPAWKFLSLLESEYLLGLVALRHLPPGETSAFAKILEASQIGVRERCEALGDSKLPVYFTTWIGHSAEEIAAQITQQHEERDIALFKLKVGPNIDLDFKKLKRIRSLIAPGISLAVDANQTLTFDEACTWMGLLSDLRVVWLEEPFAPDNVTLFRNLAEEKERRSWSCEIATGENCPNTQTAYELVRGGLDRFQSDPCRMMGLPDGMVTALIAHGRGVAFTPHAGGAGLDELSPHLQLFNLARVDITTDPEDTLTETIGFCSHLYENPIRVENGSAFAPDSPGLGVRFEASIESRIRDYREGITWLEL